MGTLAFHFYLLLSLHCFLVFLWISPLNCQNESITFSKSSSATTESVEKPKFTYEKLIQMRKTLVQDLIKMANRLKGNTTSHAPPGGSQVLTDNYPAEGMTYIKTNVQVVVTVSRIDFMNVNSQTLTFAAEVGLAWIDTNLKWDYSAADFPIYNIVINPDTIWTPKLLPQDLIGYDYIPSTVKPTVTVFHQGYVISKVTATIVAPCDVEVLTYPFDTHHCHLRFTQSFDPGARINFIAVSASDKSESDLMFNTKHRHREWDLVFLNSSSNEDGQSYHLEIILKRKAIFYAIVLIMPCIILNMLSFLMFFVEVSGTGRVDLALNLILSFFVLQIILVESIPPSGGDVPLLGLYFTVSTAIVVFMMLGSLLLIGLHNMKVNGKPVPMGFKCLSTKFVFHRRRKTLIYKVYAANNNPANAAKSGQELTALSTRDKETDSVEEQDTKEEQKMDAVIYNLNLLLFFLTLIIHITLLVSICVIWAMKTK